MVNPVLIISMIISIFVIVIGTLFLFFTRQGKNFLTVMAFNKKYVICHLRREATDFEDVWKVVPKPDYLTTVGKFDYDLNPRYAILKWGRRLHFILHENDAIPQYINREDNNNEILMQVKEIKTALHNKSYDFLYAKNKNIALILCAVGLVISIIVAIYCAYEIQKIAPLVQWLYDHPPATVPDVTVIQ